MVDQLPEAMETMDRNGFRLLDRAALVSWQLERLNRLLVELAKQPFYEPRLRDIRLPLRSIDQLDELPLLNKTDLAGEQRGQAAKIFSRPHADYTRFHQTSGTSGHPLPVLDTPSDWQWWLACWQYVLDAADVAETDVAMMAFSFGPFIGFWTAHDALVQRGAMVVPGGGMSSESRLRMIADHGCTLLCCTPTYALHLAAVAERLKIDLPASTITRVIVAGEPGGSIPSVRRRMEQAWGAKVIDHTGASEVGAWGFGSPDGQGIHVIEAEFIAELLNFDDPDPGGRPAAEGETAELVLTNLGRFGGPAIRYRTGDLVRGFRDHDQPCRFLWLEGGVLGRSDAMLVIRGVNVFPSSIEAIVREVEGTAEFRITASRHDEMDQLDVEVETSPAGAADLTQTFRDRLGMRVEVRAVAAGTLPRFEAKARRWVDEREQTQP